MRARWPRVAAGSAGPARSAAAAAGNRLGIVVQVVEPLPQFTSTLGVRCDALPAGDLRPRAVERRVQVDPRDQPVPGLRVELHAVVARASICTSSVVSAWNSIGMSR